MSQRSGGVGLGKNRNREKPEVLSCRDDLLGSLEHAWQMLVEGTKNRRLSFHLGTLATVDTDGHPRVRTVVLRDCDREQRWLRFNTDQRSPKMKQLDLNPRAEMLFYDEDKKIQLRLQVRLEPMAAADTDQIWDMTPWYSRECYQVTRAPSSPVSSPEDVQFDAETAGGGRDHFAPVRAHIESIEWLYLSAQKHRRARFVFTGDSVDAQWLVP